MKNRFLPRPPTRYTTSLAGIALIQEFEKCRLKAYLDGGGVWTIGWGTTRYPDGRRVKQGDVCTQAQADAWMRADVASTEYAVDALTADTISQKQFDALVSLTYNIGTGGYKGSTLRRRVNINPNDPRIRPALMAWHYDNGKPIFGLWRRRHKEADFYFGVQTPVPLPPFPTR